MSYQVGTVFTKLTTFLSILCGMQTLKIDGYIGKDDGMSAFFGGTPNVSLKFVSDFIDKLPEGTTELGVEINSGGGEVNEGFAIHDKLASSGLAIHTEVLGLCGSIATVIALAAKTENRSMHQNSEYFIHNPFWQPMSPEAMEADDLQRLAEDLRNSEEKILDFYVNKTGESRKSLKALMEDAKGISAKDAKKLGFVSKIITEATNKSEYRIAAYINPTKIKNSDMEFSPTQKSWIEKQFSAFAEKFNKVFTPVFKAMAIDLESGAKIWIDTEDGEFVGKKAFLADEAGNKTNDVAPDGEHKLKDGRTITVKDGTVTAVAEATAAVPDETAALKAKVADLEAQLKTATEAKAEVETTVAKQEENFVALKKDFTALQNMVLGKEIPPADQNFKGGNVELSDKQKWFNYEKSQRELKAKTEKK